MTVDKPPAEAPKASFSDLSFITSPAEFTKRAVASFGPVWEIQLPPGAPRVFGVAGAAGTKAFCDCANIGRLPTSDRNIMTYSWTSNGFPGLPFIDNQNFLNRKAGFVEAAAPRSDRDFLPLGFDVPLGEALPAAGKNGQPFSYWKILGRVIFDAYSTLLFGPGIKDIVVDPAYPAGDERQAEAVIAAVEDAFSLFGAKQVDQSVQINSKEILQTRFYRGVLAAIRKNPGKYSETLLSRHMRSEEGEKLNDDELITDMIQMFCPGTFAMHSQGTCLMYRLLKHPDIRAKIAEEVEQLEGPLTLPQLRSLKYTQSVVKETHRFYPAVFATRGGSIREFTVEGVKIPIASTVLCCLWGTLNDPQVYPKPEEFVPERHLPPRSEGDQPGFNNWEVVYGAGDISKGHACGGKWIAFYHLVLMAARLAQSWDFEMVDANEKISWPVFAPKADNGLMIRRARPTRPAGQTEDTAGEEAADLLKEFREPGQWFQNLRSQLKI